MTKIRKPKLICAAISVIFSLAVAAGCSESSPKLYCSQAEDAKDYEDTGLTLKKLMKQLDQKKLSYKYDEKDKVLEFDGAKIFLKDHASGLLAYKATQRAEKMEIGSLRIGPKGDYPLNPCKLIALIKK